MTVEGAEKQLVTNGNGVYSLQAANNGFQTTVENNFGFSNLPYREPIDLQVKDITCTVNMGWNKGKLFDLLEYLLCCCCMIPAIRQFVFLKFHRL